MNISFVACHVAGQCLHGPSWLCLGGRTHRAPGEKLQQTDQFVRDPPGRGKLPKAALRALGGPPLWARKSNFVVSKWRLPEGTKFEKHRYSQVAI